MLLWSVVLGLVQLVIASMATNNDVGLPYNLSSRDEPCPPVGKTAGRLQRAVLHKTSPHSGRTSG